MYVSENIEKEEEIITITKSPTTNLEIQTD